MNGYRVPLAIIVVAITTVMGVVGAAWSNHDTRISTVTASDQQTRERVGAVEADARASRSTQERMDRQVDKLSNAADRLQAEISRLAVLLAGLDARPR